MTPETELATNTSEARRLVVQYGGFHDCSILSLVQDYSCSRIEVKVDSLGCGIEFPSNRPGVLVFEQVKYVLCRIPFVGGEVRIDSVEFEESEDGIVAMFELSTTEWLDLEEFKVVDARIECGRMKIEHDCDEKQRDADD